MVIIGCAGSKGETKNEGRLEDEVEEECCAELELDTGNSLRTGEAFDALSLLLSVEVEF